MAETSAGFPCCGCGEGQRAVAPALDHVLGLLMLADPSKKGTDITGRRAAPAWTGLSLVLNLDVDVLIPQ